MNKGQVAILHTSVFMEHTSQVSIHTLFFTVYTVQSLYNVIFGVRRNSFVCLFDLIL